MQQQGILSALPLMAVVVAVEVPGSSRLVTCNEREISTETYV